MAVPGRDASRIREDGGGGRGLVPGGADGPDTVGSKRDGWSAGDGGERLKPPDGGSGDVTPERPRWTIVARVDRAELYPTLARSFARSVWVAVVVDRRRGDRRRQQAEPEGDRRLAGRRRSDQDPAQIPAFRLARKGDGFEIFEATGPEPGRCPVCGAMVSVDMPRFAEPPVRLELTVVHEPVPPDRARHVVELQSLSAAGRVLLATRLFARTGLEPT